MRFSAVAEACEKIEATTKRLEMTDHLVHLIEQTPPETIDRVTYLIVGELYPPFMGIELGVAEKLAIKAVAIVTGKPDGQVEAEYKRQGDLGKTVRALLGQKTQATLAREPLTVERVYETFDKVAQATGSGAQEMKIKLLVSLLNDATPNEAKYITRMVLGKLRLGVADMTLLDALAVAYGGGKQFRESIERAYNVSSDIGYVARVLATKGMEEIEHFEITLGRPVKPQLAERLTTLEEILEKLGGRCSAEYKYDGLRVQSQISPREIQLFSRREENITGQFPDLVKALRKAVAAQEAILDGECVPVDPNTGDLLPFQIVSQRRGRKYDIEKMVGEVPVVLFVFDLLYLNGKDFTLKPYPERRAMLSKIVRRTDAIRIAENIVSGSAKEIEAYFEKAVNEGTEGLICKSIAPESVYEAGKRGWQWIKWKRSYRSEMTDTVDLVVVGAFAGRGKRAGSYGALLMAAYVEDEDRFDTVCKLGSGFTDEDLAKLPGLFKPYQLSHPHSRVNSLMKPDIWFVPTKVLEVIGDEITLSPLHTCGFGAVREGSGLAIRFPRLVKFRVDRSPEDATTSKEVLEMYNRQPKKVAG